MFCGQQLLCAYLRPSRIDGAKHAAAILKLLVQRLRQQWPQVRIVFRGDSGFCRSRILNYCERADVGYIVGLARNARLQAITEFMELAIKDAFEHTGAKQREIGAFMYATQSWAKERRVITRLQYGEQGNNPRYVESNLQDDAQALYDDVYCQRGEAENRIKEAQVGLFATRTSCQQFQSTLSGCARWRSRAPGLRQPRLIPCASSYSNSPPWVTRNTRRIRLYLASNWSSADIFATAMRQLRSP